MSEETVEQKLDRMLDAIEDANIRLQRLSEFLDELRPMVAIAKQMTTGTKMDKIRAMRTLNG